MSTEILTTIGLCLDIFGVALLFKFGPLQPHPETRPSIALEDNTPLEDGRTVKAHEEENVANLKLYDRRSRMALVIIILGFCFQIAGVWNK